ncbi:NAD synthetase, NH3-dependent [Campylobacter insulaenigrae]|uniref:NH(3)-dependent NAD(+) synthetase n=1 Tax=Campylobacter insulaenigrae NCTC 12927 TaxID=1031564 RepID=A0A0A8H1A6_9BACT|nr:NAD synthetase, NH3-dependent [Campylobacter insulaenigrae]AJC87831.1 NAD synthetase, NH3-dependent [Campylobacter insulaenigrae NCTC 12927]MCR6570386.1 NAD synthetase, NH3-dependent [Campylobacter insulaenigrae]MCR6573425.1 NAD synthetase, NH3-dependent [Campylobacter insulaenigrae]MCR6574890.1 NAD synthetase, NH3-dependent [Campylobacter insulaenigrae]MCR6576418.1 NAD synthetase, NH3-dependent [Campylobacter insulaenigrae]
MNYTKLQELLINFIRKNAKDKNLILGLSGGIDSAVVACLCKQAIKDKLYVLLMPTKYSKKDNLNDAIMLCNTLNIKYKIIYIDSILENFELLCEKPDKLRKGNLAARIRMSLLYDYSALKNALVVGTSNKSELMLGYGTIYGDLACAFNPLATLYKSEIFEFAKFLNLHENFIKKPPSADLWPNQSDEDDLGYTYKELDSVLKAIENNQTLENFDEKLKRNVLERMQNNTFKRKLPTTLENFDDLD